MDHPLHGLPPPFGLQAPSLAAVVSPVPGDPDSLASCTLISEWLLSHKIQHDLICPKIPSIEERPLLKFLNLGKFRNSFPRHPKEYSHVFITDYGDFRTTGLDTTLFLPTCTFIGFDHHDLPAQDFPKNGAQIWERESASTTIVVYKFLKAMGFFINRKIAMQVLLGIYGDTAALGNSRVNPEALEIIAECMRLGAPWEKIQEAAHERMTFQIMELWEEVFPEIRETFDRELGMALFIADRRRTMRWGGCKNVETILDRMIKLDETKVAIMFSETLSGVWKISFRSKDKKISVAAIASHFGGGGHWNMAVGIWDGMLIDGIAKARQMIYELKKKA